MENRRKPLHRQTLKYLRRSWSSLSLNVSETNLSDNVNDGKVIVIDDAVLAERFQKQYIQLLELETQQGRRLNEELFFKFLSQEGVSAEEPPKTAPKSLKFLRLFRCSEARAKTTEPPPKTCLVECQCCYDQIDLTFTAMCENDHIFCHSCIVKGTDMAISSGASFVRCFAECEDEFSLPTLRSVISRKTYEILMRKRQEEEIAAAKLDFLECCPFCPYQMELDAGVPTFYCQNPECMKVSCRSCKKIYHYDVKCEDVLDEHKGRLFVEEEMSEALIRKCYNCKRPFVLWDGCNKIQCSCGASMCYRCRQPITGYSHFDQTGGKCKKKYHYEAKCENVLDEHKGRLLVEEEMSKALIRSCYRCNKPFVIRDGCNKVKCSCGAMMCYKCRKPISGYMHFNMPGGCSLYENWARMDEVLVEKRRDETISKIRRDYPHLEIPKI